MEGLATYQKGTDDANREKHGLEVGDVVEGGIGPAVEVVEVDHEGVKFSDGSTACHRTVVINMTDVGAL